MTVCQICGDEGYSKLLIRCVQCREISVHRYCVLEPFFCEDEKINWSCEFCDPDTTEPTAVVPEPDRKKTKKKSIPPQSKKPNVPQKETAKEAEASDRSILYQKNVAESVKRKHVKLKETGIPVLPNVSDATEVVATEKGDNHSKDVDGSEQELPQSEDVPPRVSDATEVLATGTANSVNSNKDAGSEQDLSPSSKRPRRPANTKKGKKNEDSVSDTSLKKEYSDAEKPDGKHPRQLKPSADAKMEKKIKDSSCSTGVKTRSSDAVRVKKQNIKNVDSSDSAGDQQLKRGKNLGSRNLKKVSSPKKTDNFDKLGSGANKLNKLSSESDQLEELPTNKKQPGTVQLNDHDKTKEAVVEETVVDCSHDHLAVVPSDRDVSQSKAPRKKRKVVIEVEYSDEDPVFVLSKHPQFVASVWKDSLSNSCSEAISKLSDDGLAQLSSIESIPHQSSLVKVDNRVGARESSVVFENDIPSQPVPLNMVSHVLAQPLVDVAWRGYCNVADEFPPMSLVLEAHFSNKAHEKVQGAVSVLPEVLNFVFVPKVYAWPKTYERSPPTADGIGLYFFPVDESFERLYFHLVDTMASCDLVLKSVINNLELLIFCSVELPREEWRFRRRYYLWGVFRPRKDLIMPNVPLDVYHVDNVLVPEFSNTHFHQETMGHSVGHRRDAEFSDYTGHNHDHRGSSDIRDRRTRRSKGWAWNNSGRSQKSYRSKESIVLR